MIDLENKKTIALIGADGQLGMDLQKLLNSHFIVVPLTINDINISNLGSIENCLSKFKSDIVLSTAGFHNVPFCEEQPENTFLINAVGTKFLADWCHFHHCKLVFISTDYVFNGNRSTPYIEEDYPDPINTYGISKLAGELYIKHHLEDHLIVRTTGLYGSNVCLGKPTANFIEMFLKLIQGKDKVEFDGREICCPTYTLELANQILILLQKNIKGLFHVVNEGPCSWFEFGEAIIKELGIDTQLRHVEREESIEHTMKHFQPLKRPFNTALENKGLKLLNINYMSSCREALHRFIQNRKPDKK